MSGGPPRGLAILRAVETTDISAPRRRLALLLKFARPYRWQFVLVAIFALLATGTDLLAPVIYREAINDIAGLFVGEPGTTGADQLLAEEDEPLALVKPEKPQPHQRGHVAARTAEQAVHTLLEAVGLLLVINVVSHLCSLIADQRTVRLASRIEADVIQRTFSHVLRLPLRFFSRRASGGIAKQIDQSDEVAPIVSAFAHDIAPEVIRMVGVMAIMFTQSWKLTLAALITLPPYLFIVALSSRRLETGLTQYYEMWDAVSGRIQDALGAVKTVKLSGAEQRESDGLRASSENAYATYVRRNKLANSYLFWQTSLSYVSHAMVLGYGGLLVSRHQLTPGDIVMFVAYLDRLYVPIESLTGLAVSLQERFASFSRAAALMAEPGAEQPGGPLPPGPGLVEFQKVTFSYLPERPVLRDVTMRFAAGKVTAVVGPSGAGKTTASDLLLRLFEPQSGVIRIDGTPIQGVDAAIIRREVGVVAADGAIFSGTLADNIRYKRPEASDGEVRDAANECGLGPLLDRLPDGLLTEVGERGTGLSLGERQRLQIARALVARPRVLVLDEATANLDYATESEIRSSLLDRANRPTTIIIAHRYSMVEFAEHVIVMEAGRIVDEGSPAELISHGGWFARFAAAAGHLPEESVEPREEEEADE